MYVSWSRRIVRLDAGGYPAGAVPLLFPAMASPRRPGRKEERVQETSLVLAIEDPALQDEVLHFLGRVPRLRVVGAAVSAPELARRIRERRPDVAVVSPSVLGGANDLDGAALLVVGTAERAGDLRLALRAGARGFYLWPEERHSLGRDAARLAPPPSGTDGARGRVVAVYGPRGGAGTTFLATNLAAAWASAGSETILADLDLFFADVTAALGFDGDEGTGSVADLVPVLDEVAPEHVEPVLRLHAAGFRTLTAPAVPDAVRVIGADRVAALVKALRQLAEVVVLHLPRCIDDGVRGALESADQILIVVTLDVLAFRDARRALGLLADLGLGNRVQLVINRASRSEVIPEDSERVFGLRPVAVIRHDRSVPRAQNRGELIAGRSGPAARGVRALAARLTTEAPA
jgi:pilus assembly protein CpaE